MIENSNLLLDSQPNNNNLINWRFKPNIMSVTDYPFDPKLEEEKREAEEDDSNDNPPPDIVAYNELRSCSDLVRLAEGQLDIAPDFQRGFVWSPADQTRFIDSLIKGLPIPSLCISYDYSSNKRQVIDGRQRIQTIINFLTQQDYQLSRLEDIEPKISGQSVFSIKKDNNIFFERVESLTIPVTVIRCDYSKKEHMQYLFKIFHRLNSGGVKLTNQEIRNCIYTGEFNSFLKETVLNKDYANLMGLELAADGKPIYYRFAFEELNLRFFALYDGLDNYTGKLTRFLNDYMMSKKTKEDREGKDAILKEILDKNLLFAETIKIIKNNLKTIPIHTLSKAIIEALFIGVGSNLENIKDRDEQDIPKYLEEKFIELRNDETIKLTLQGGIAKKTNVLDRLKRAKEIFSN
jgi:hypothetical protein